MKVNIMQDRLAMKIVCMAIGEDTHIIDQFDNTKDGEHEICLTVDGVELNFLNVINDIDRIFDKAVERRAGEMYLEKYDRRSDEISSELGKIAERLKEIRSTKFPEINWEDE